MNILYKMSAVVLKYLFLGCIVLISLIPLLWGLLSSFKNNAEILLSPFSLPEVWSFSNYTEAFRTAPIARYYLNSLSITAMCIIGGLLIFSMAAYVFAFYDFKGKKALFSTLSLSLLVPPTAIIFPVYLIINRVGLYNSKLGLTLVYLALALPTVLYVLKSFFMSIPKELEEAARIDGASFVRIFVSIMLPLTTPALATSAILIFLASWNDFLYALILTSGDRARTVPIALTQFTGLYGAKYGQLFASSMLVVIPSIILYICLQKRIETALLSGAVKG